jgi:hypothetical protein
VKLVNPETSSSQETVMRRVFAIFGVLVLSAGLAAAQDKAATEKALIANENKVNDAVAKGDKAAFSALVPSDSMMADGNGVMTTADFLPVFDTVKITTWKITDAKVEWVDASTAIVIYTWTGTGTFQGQKVPPKVYASTVWTKRGDKWVAVYHQESAAAPAPKPAAKK